MRIWWRSFTINKFQAAAEIRYPKRLRVPRENIQRINKQTMYMLSNVHTNVVMYVYMKIQLSQNRHSVELNSLIFYPNANGSSYYMEAFAAKLWNNMCCVQTDVQYKIQKAKRISNRVKLAVNIQKFPSIKI